MNISRCVLVKWHRLQQDIVGTLWWLLNVNELKKNIISFENIGIGLLADLTFKFLPVVTCHIFPVFFYMTLRFYPILKALEMNQTNRTSALASEDQRVILIFFWAPTKSAIYLFLITIPVKRFLLLKVVYCFDSLCFLKLLSV